MPPVTPPRAAASRAGTLRSLQVMRGLAALFVVCYHLGLTIAPTLGGAYPFPAFFRQGYSGVDVFFCLSGFIIYHAHAADLGRADRLRSFAIKRAVRIYPVYWFVTALIVVGSFWFPRLTDVGVPSAGFVLKSLLLVPQGREPVLTPGWTLVHELRFYATFAVLMLAPRRWFIPLVGALGIGSVAVLHATTWAPALVASGAGKLALLLFHPVTAEFALGVLAGALWREGRTSPAFDAAMAIAGVVLYAAAVAWHDALTPEGAKYHATMVYAAPAFLLVLGLVLAERRWRPPVPAPLERLGDASYSLYLVHWPVIRLLVPWVVGASLARALPGGALLVACTIAAALACYYWVERPSLQRLRHLAGDRPKPHVAEEAGDLTPAGTDPDSRDAAPAVA